MQMMSCVALTLVGTFGLLFGAWRMGKIMRWKIKHEPWGMRKWAESGGGSYDYDRGAAGGKFLTILKHSFERS